MEGDSRSITERQWDLVCYIEEFWGENKAFPRLVQIKANVPGYATEAEITEELYLPAVKLRLDNRGVIYGKRLKRGAPEQENPSRLSDKQLAVINTLLNPFDRRAQSKKLSELGITATTLNGWMKDARFREYYNARSEDLFGPEGMPIAHEALMRKVGEGNLGAIKLYYEVAGRHVSGARNEEITNLKLLFVRLTEVLQRYVAPDTLRTIINEFNDITALNGVALNSAAPPVAERGYSVHNYAPSAIQAGWDGSSESGGAYIGSDGDY